MTTVVVGNTLDIVDGDTSSIAALVASPGSDGISLREAIVATNNDSVEPSDTITFDSAVFGSAQSIPIGTQLPTITQDLIIDGPGADLLTVDAGSGNDGVPGTEDGHRVFELSDGDNANSINVQMSGMTLTGGDTAADGGAIKNAGEHLTLTGMEITGNAGSAGGGVYSFDGNLVISESTFSTNISTATGVAGGGAIFSQGTLTVSNSTLSANSAVEKGGGIQTNGDTSISDITIFANSVTSSTGDGGGIFVDGGNTTLSNSIVAGNSATGGGSDVGGSIDADFSLIGDGDGATINDIGGNLIGSSSGSGVIDPLLGPLTENGGATHTHVPQAGSPALDAGLTTSTADQRGLVRPFDLSTVANATGSDASDIGAVERQNLLAFTSPTTADVVENLQVVHTLVASDAESPGQAITYSITGNGASNSLFEIVNGDALQFKGAPDFESPINPDLQTIYTNDLDHHANPATYTDADLDADWNEPVWNDGVTEGRVTIVTGAEAYGGSGSALRVSYPAGEYGTKDTGAQWKLDFDNGHEEAILEYKLKFGTGFDFVRGGKLPGLAGGTAPSGSTPADGVNGWNGRSMWRTDFTGTSGNPPQDVAEAISYAKYTDSGFAGDGTEEDKIYWLDSNNERVEIQSGGWNAIRQYVKMNTPGVSDGILQFWLDGQLVHDQQNVLFRTTASLQIDLMYFSTFFGGGSSWQTSKDEVAYFDDFEIYVPTSTNAPPLDNVYEVTVQAASANGDVVDQTIAVNVTPQNDNAPEFTSAASVNVVENSQTVVTLMASDADVPSQPISFSITGSGADNDDFVIVNDNQLQFIANPDFETPHDSDADNVYEVTVQADDGNGEVVAQTIAVNVTPQNDNAPTFTSAAAVNVDENSQTVLALMANDADFPSQPISFSITGSGADNAGFVIVNDNELQFVAPADFEVPTDFDGDNVYEVTVQADDGNGLVTPQTLMVTVNDLDEGLIVTTAADEINNDGMISLREAISFANFQFGPDTITFSPSVFDGELTDVIRLQSELMISEDLQIDGGTQAIVITGDANGDDTLVAGTSITDVVASQTAGGLTDNVRVINFTAPAGQQLQLTGSTVTGGRTSTDGGGIYTEDGSVSIVSSTVGGNDAGGSGGGIRVGSGLLTVTNSTVSGNSASDGGGIYSSNAAVTVESSTITGNAASSQAGGIGVLSDDNGESLTVHNSIVAGNTDNGTAPDFVAPGNPLSNLSISYSLIGDNAGSSLTESQTPDANGNLIGGSSGGVINPMLGVLSDNGGSTQTHAVLAGSPAISAGDPNAVAGQNGVPLLDQRGVDRVLEGRLEMGSLEFALEGVTVASPSNNAVISSPPVTISGRATDNATVSRVELVIYNDQLQTWNGTSFTSVYTRVDATLDIAGSISTSWTYSFEAPSEGKYTFRATATDGVDNMTDGPWSQFSVSNEAPSIALTTPTANYVPVNGAISGTASDDSGVAHVQMVIYNGHLQTWNGTAFTSSYSVVNATLSNPGATSTSWSYNGNLPNGAYIMRAYALDVASQRTNSSWRAFYVGNDTAAPGVAITNPANGSTNSGSVSLEGTSTDDIAVRQVELVIYNSQLQTWNGSAFTSTYTRVRTSLSNPGGTASNWTYNFAAPAGSYTFRAIASDGSNKSTNSSWRTFSIT